eukprot:SAG22_NODE_86_length_21440_cov_288.248700_27_plen_657_part_00
MTGASHDTQHRDKPAAEAAETQGLGTLPQPSIAAAAVTESVLSLRAAAAGGRVTAASTSGPSTRLRGLGSLLIGLLALLGFGAGLVVMLSPGGGGGPLDASGPRAQAEHGVGPPGCVDDNERLHEIYGMGDRVDEFTCEHMKKAGSCHVLVDGLGVPGQSGPCGCSCPPESTAKAEGEPERRTAEAVVKLMEAHMQTVVDQCTEESVAMIEVWCGWQPEGKRGVLTEGRSSADRVRTVQRAGQFMADPTLGTVELTPTQTGFLCRQTVRQVSHKALPLPCVSTAFLSKTVPFRAVRPARQVLTTCVEDTVFSPGNADDLCVAALRDDESDAADDGGLHGERSPPDSVRWDDWIDWDSRKERALVSCPEDWEAATECSPFEGSWVLDTASVLRLFLLEIPGCGIGLGPYGHKLGGSEDRDQWLPSRDPGASGSAGRGGFLAAGTGGREDGGGCDAEAVDEWWVPESERLPASFWHGLFGPNKLAAGRGADSDIGGQHGGAGSAVTVRFRSDGYCGALHAGIARQCTQCFADDSDLQQYCTKLTASAWEQQARSKKMPRCRFYMPPPLDTPWDPSGKPRGPDKEKLPHLEESTPLLALDGLTCGGMIPVKLAAVPGHTLSTLATKVLRDSYSLFRKVGNDHAGSRDGPDSTPDTADAV